MPSDWVSMLRAVCFDVMGTVIADPYRDAIEAATGLDIATAARLKDPDSWPAFEAAHIDEATFAQRFFADPDGGRVFDIAVFNRVRRGGYAWLPGMRELLDALAGEVERYAASNYPIWIEELAATFAFERRFTGVYASHHLGVRKPDLAFYVRLLDAIGHPPQACLFVDDRADNCAGAEAAGMRAHRFVGADDLAARLTAEGVAVDRG